MKASRAGALWLSAMRKKGSVRESEEGGKEGGNERGHSSEGLSVIFRGITQSGLQGCNMKA